MRVTATSGHTIPPILPTELATPTPVVLIDVGYNCSSPKGEYRKRDSQIKLYFGKHTN